MIGSGVAIFNGLKALSGEMGNVALDIGFDVIGIDSSGSAPTYEPGKPTAVAPVPVIYGRPGWIATTPVVAGYKMENIGTETEGPNYARLEMYSVVSEGISRTPEAIRIEGKLSAYAPRYTDEEALKLSPEQATVGMFNGTARYSPGLTVGPYEIDGRLDSTFGRFALDNQQGLFGLALLETRYNFAQTADNYAGPIPIVEVLPNGTCLHDPRIPFTLADSYVYTEAGDYFQNYVGVVKKSAIGGVAKGWSSTYPLRQPNIERGYSIYGWKDGTSTSKNQLGDSPDTNSILAALDYLVDDIYGADIPLQDINLPSAITEANYCDALAPTTQGGPSQNQFSCNIVLKTDQKIKDNLKKLLATCRAKIAWIDGQYHFHISKAGEPIRGTIDKQILKRVKVTLGDRSKRYNRLIGTYVEPAAGYQKRQVVYPPVDSAEDIQFRQNEDKGVTNEQKMELHGCTNAYQAADLLAVFLRESRRSTLVEYECNLELMQYTLGDIVRVTDPDGLWTNKLCRIVKWSLDFARRVIRIVVADHSDADYDNLVKPVLIRDEGTQINTAAELNKNLNLQMQSGDSTLYIGPDGTVLAGMEIQWNENTAATGFDVRYKRSIDESYTTIPTVDGNATKVVIRPIVSGEFYDIQVRAKTRSKTADWQTLQNVQALGKQALPPGVVNFYVDGQSLSWDEPVSRPLDFAGYELRYHVGVSQNWDTAQHVHEGLITETQYTVPFALYGEMVLLLKTVDTSGNRSAGAAIIASGFGDLPVENVMFSENLLANFNHRLIVSGEAQTDGRIFAAASGDLYDAARADIYDAADFWAPWGYSDISVVYAIDLPVTVKSGEQVYLSAGISGDSQQIEVSWGNTGDTQPADPWRVVPRVLSAPEVKRRLFVRVAVAGAAQGNLRPTLNELSVLVDVPDVEESISDLSITSVQTLQLQKSYRVITGIAITLQNQAGSSAVGAEIISKNNLAPQIRCFDVNRQTVAGIVDVKIQGY